MWISAAELKALPKSGTPYNAVLSAANAWNGAPPDLSSQDATSDQQTARMYAAALIAVANGNTTLRDRVRSACLNVRETENGGRVLSFVRHITQVNIACGLVDADPAYATWLRGAAFTESYTECGTVPACHERRPNNWGQAAAAARMSSALYLGDATQRDRTLRVERGFFGDRSQYTGFSFSSPAETYDCGGSLSTTNGITPSSCTRLSGHVPDDDRRGGRWASTPPPSGYVWEARQYPAIFAILAERHGAAAATWSNGAIDRMYERTRLSYSAPSGNDQYQPWMQFCLYGRSSWPRSAAAGAGRGMSWTAWTHAAASACDPVGSSAPPPAPAPTPSPTPGTTPPSAGSGTGTFDANADAYVRDGMSTANFGTADPLFVDGGPAGEVRHVYIRFPTNGTGGATSVRLRINALESGSTIEVRSAQGGWTESGLTWSNRPAYGAVLATFNAAPGVNTITLPVSALAASGPTTLVLTRPGTSRLEVTSRESATAASRPQLIVG